MQLLILLERAVLRRLRRKQVLGMDGRKDGVGWPGEIYIFSFFTEDIIIHLPFVHYPGFHRVFRFADFA